MDESIKILPNFKKFNSYIGDVKQGISPIMLSGLTDVAKIHFAYSTFFYTEKPICIVTYNELQAKKIIKDLQYFTNKVEYFPRREILSYDYLAESKDISNERINCLNNIYSKKAKIIVTTIEAASQKIVTKNELYKNIVEIKENSIIELEELKKKLFYLGYERRDLVENAGEYSIRGGIIDIGITKETGIRIELWGDEVDSIREFNIMSQRSTEKVKTAKIYPATEFVLERNIEEVISDILNDFDEEKVAEDIEEIKNGNYLSKVDKYFNYFYKNSETIIDYIKENYIIFLDEISKIKARSENIIKDNQNVIKSLMEKKRTVPQALTNLNNYIDFLGLIKNIQTIYLEKQDIGFVDKQSMHAKRNGYSFSYREVNFFRSSMDLCFKEIQQAQHDKKTIVILTGNKDNTKKVKDLLLEKLENLNNITELCNFASKLNYGKHGFNGNVVDFTMTPTFVRDNLEKFTQLMKGSINAGVFQMQMNVIDSRTLIEAKKNPAKFPNLIVRVWGFSAYFKDLPYEYQDYVIERALKNEATNY